MLPVAAACREAAARRAFPRGKRGVTLMELMCVLALMSGILLLTGRVLTSMSIQYDEILRADKAKTAITAMQETLVARLRYAQGTFVFGAPNEALSYYFCDGHRLLYHAAGTPVGQTEDVMSAYGDSAYPFPNLRVTFDPVYGAGAVAGGYSHAIKIVFWAGEGDPLTLGAFTTHHLSTVTVQPLVANVSGTPSEANDADENSPGKSKAYYYLTLIPDTPAP